ncbi:protein-tyrosine phosphatase-like protein, partial [Tribonema minus]
QDDALAAVLPGKVYFGSIDAAFNLEGLQAKGITHIINASGKAVDMYTGVQYCNFALRDREGADVLAVVAQTNELIAAVLRAEGRVLVNCWAGRSRSAAIAVGFLMAKHGRSYDDAVEQLRAQRPAVKINIGFERQLRAFG